MVMTRLALSVGTLVALLLLAEVGLRVASPVPTKDLLPFTYDQDRIQRIVDDDSYLRFDRDLGWIPAPNFVRRSSGQVFRTNGLGMRAERDYSLAVPLDEGLVRPARAAFGGLLGQSGKIHMGSEDAHGASELSARLIRRHACCARPLAAGA